MRFAFRAAAWLASALVTFAPASRVLALQSDLLTCDGWQQYVVGPTTRELQPLSATLQDVSGEHTASADAAGVRLEHGDSLILDFGAVVSGKVEIDTQVSSGPLIRVSPSESRAFLRPGGDSDAYANGAITHRPAQTGESWHTTSRRTFRYLLVDLPEPGWVDFARIGVYFTAPLGPPSAFQGTFLSSDDQLNRIWYHAAYTLQLVTAPGTSTVLDGTLEPWRGQLDIAAPAGRRLGLTAPGADWQDYDLDLDVTLATGTPGAGWAIRSAPDGFVAFRIALGDADRPARLQRWVGTRQAAYLDAERPVLDVFIDAGRPLHVHSEVRGPSAATWLDGRPVGIDAIPDYASGRVGFWATAGDQFTIANVRVTDPGGGVLFADEFSGDLLDSRRWVDAPEALFLDGAKRDRALGVADLAVEAATQELSFGDSGLVAKLLADIGAHQYANGKLPGGIAGPDRFVDDAGQQLPDYSLWWIVAVRDHIWRTGDRALLEAMLPHAEGVLNWAEQARRTDALLPKGPGDDWYFSADRGPGALTSLNSLYVAALRAAADLERQAGDVALAASRTMTADAVARATNAELWDDAAGAYRDGESLPDHHPLDGNALAIVFDVAPPDRAARALRFMKAQLWSDHGSRTADLPYGAWAHDGTTWPAYVAQEVAARFHASDDEDALDLLRRTWGAMLGQDPASTFWEYLSPDGGIPAGSTSLAHGWSTGALPLLSEWVLGVQPTAPGYASYTVEPHPGDLSHACGSVPTPWGAIRIGWTFDGARFTLALDSPSQTVGTLRLPPAREWTDLRLDDSPVDATAITVGSGPHVLTAKWAPRVGNQAADRL